jgi:ketosteroid isomerase-like protein
MRFEERDGRIYAGDDHAVAEWTARATHPDTGRVIEWDGIDLIQVRDGRICRNAVYSSAHAARELDQPT